MTTGPPCVLRCPGVDNLNGSAKRVMGLAKGHFGAQFVGDVLQITNRDSWPIHNGNTQISLGSISPINTCDIPTPENN